VRHFLKTSHVMKNHPFPFSPIILRISATAIAAVGILLLILGMQKEITLVVNGEIQQISTSALTVRGVLRSQDYQPTEWDRVFPSLGTILWGDETVNYRISSKVDIQADGEEISLQTAEDRPENVLLQAGFSLFPKDRILLDGQEVGKSATLSAGEDHNIQVLRGTPITVETKTGTIQFISDGDTLGEAFQDEAFQILDADQLSKPLDTPLDGSPLLIEWIQAIPINVQIADQSITIYTTAETIGAALAGAGLPLQGLDYSIPAEYEAIPENHQVQVIRVREEVLLNQDKIQFSTTYQPDNNTELDGVSILSGGEFGITAQRVRVTYENDEETTRQLVKEWVLREPSPRVIGYGTKIVLRTENTADGPITYWRKITAYATSYNENCAGCNDWTYSGAYLQKGVVAVTRPWYRIMAQNKVYIPNYGFGSIEDIGAGVPFSTNWVDLGYRSEDYVSWHWYTDVYFLAPAPPADQIMYILY
jgi:uncharacterized protein YabE (DUF348 family)